MRLPASRDKIHTQALLAPKLLMELPTSPTVSFSLTLLSALTSLLRFPRWTRGSKRTHLYLILVTRTDITKRADPWKEINKYPLINYQFRNYLLR